MHKRATHGETVSIFTGRPVDKAVSLRDGQLDFRLRGAGGLKLKNSSESCFTERRRLHLTYPHGAHPPCMLIFYAGATASLGFSFWGFCAAQHYPSDESMIEDKRPFRCLCVGCGMVGDGRRCGGKESALLI